MSIAKFHSSVQATAAKDALFAALRLLSAADPDAVRNADEEGVRISWEPWS